MSNVLIKIDWTGGNYGAVPDNGNLACVATGKTLEEVERNIEEALHFHLEGMRDNGETIPEEFEGEWTPVFRLTTRAQLKYAGKYITRKALSRETGIAEQQLSHYANGQRHPRIEMQRRITAGIQSICKRLTLIL